jgi:hypothetical protein
MAREKLEDKKLGKLRPGRDRQNVFLDLRSALSGGWPGRRTLERTWVAHMSVLRVGL